MNLIQAIQGSGYHVNHLVNNARSLDSLKTDSLGQTSREDFLAEYLMDVVVPYELSMGLFNAQPDQLCTITNIGSQYGVVAANPHLYDDYPKQSPIQYGVAKAALGHLTKELAVRMASKGVRVNCIAYGGVEGRVDEAFKARYAELTPSGRMLSESEILGPLDFLVQESSSSVTGQTLVADGGWSVW
jgi:NAD(P)-dependent dehydrogenase (short-subunit alcohol dehydrogenase family)